MSTWPAAVTTWLGERSLTVTTSHALNGGCIADVRRLRLSDGSCVVCKQDHQAPPGQFPGEAAGLRALAAVTVGPRVPTVLAVDDRCLLLEDLASGPRQRDYWPTFGTALARLHHHYGPHFGFTCTTWCGATEQPNPATSDGFAFFAEHRLGYQARLAVDHGRLSQREARLVERVGERLPKLIPAQPASLVHGDLWSGNAHVDPNGQPAMLDPSAHWGWAEADLAMTALFGGFPPEFYAAYEAARPAVAGWRDRAEVYQLYHVLNHLNLFGSSYHQQAVGIAKRWS